MARWKYVAALGMALGSARGAAADSRMPASLEQATEATEDGDIFYDTPAFLTSDAPAERPRAIAAGADLSWLQGLTMPDFPVRWDARVVEYLEHFRSDPSGRKRMRAWLKKANVYRELMRATLRAEGIPEDLVHVAMVESGFDPLVTSHAGAVGLWQFVERTGTDYGLKVTRWVDLRRDPEASTLAAAKFLKSLRARLGSWELALAAYNMGLTGLERSMQKYNTNDYWMLTRIEAGLPYETTHYVAKIMACAVVGRNLARFDYADVTVDPALAFDTVEVAPGTSVGLLAKAAGTDAKTIHVLNPALRREKTDPDRRSTVRIPKGTREAFARNWVRVRRSETAHQEHSVRFGETVGMIAKMYRTTVDELRELNELPEDGRLSPGIKLLVPAGTPVALRSKDAEPPVVAIPAGRFVYPGRARVFYQVTEVDTVERIAEFFLVSPDDVRLWNHIAPETPLARGLILQLFVKPEVDLSQAVVLANDEVNVLVVGSKEFFEYHEAQRDRVRVRYTVREGESLEHIAKRFDLSVGSVGRINGFGRGKKLTPGETLIVYVPEGKVPKGAEVLTAVPQALPDGATPPAAEGTGASSPPTPVSSPSAGDPTPSDPAAPSAP